MKILITTLFMTALPVNAFTKWDFQNAELVEMKTTTEFVFSVHDHTQNKKATFNFKLVELQDTGSCDENAHLCGKITEQLTKGDTKLVIYEFKGDLALGDIIINNHSLVLNSVKNGLYKANHDYRRSAPLVIAESKSRCKFKGVWRSLIHDIKVHEQCQMIALHSEERQSY